MSPEPGFLAQTLAECRPSQNAQIVALKELGDLGLSAQVARYRYPTFRLGEHKLVETPGERSGVSCDELKRVDAR